MSTDEFVIPNDPNDLWSEDSDLPLKIADASIELDDQTSIRTSEGAWRVVVMMATITIMVTQCLVHCPLVWPYLMNDVCKIGCRNSIYIVRREPPVRVRAKNI